MNVKITKVRDDFTIGGFSIESTGETYDKDLEAFYNDFANNGKMELLNNITKNNKEYYAVTWYDELTVKEFVWLLGQKITEKIENLEMKIIKSGEYAVSKFPREYDTKKAWEELYSKGIPGIGYKYIEENNVAFVHYPDRLDGDYELWVLVEKL